MRLDETVTRANLAIVTKGLDELYARKARLGAERDGADTPRAPKQLARIGQRSRRRRRRWPASASCSNCGARRGSARRISCSSAIKQLQEQITGLTAQQAAKSKEMEIIEQELAGVRDLWAKNLVQINRLTSLEREEARLQGERGQLIAAAAQAKGKIAETELQILQVDQELAQRRRQGAARDRQQDRRIRRTQGDRGGSAQAHRHPRAAGRHRASSRPCTPSAA